MFEGISSANVIEALVVAAIVAAVAYLFRRSKAARLRRELAEEAMQRERQREEEFERLLEEFRVLSQNRRGAAVLPAKAERQAGLKPESEAMQRLIDEGFIHRLSEHPKYCELGVKGWTWLKYRHSRGVRL